MNAGRLNWKQQWGWLTDEACNKGQWWTVPLHEPVMCHRQILTAIPRIWHRGQAVSYTHLDVYKRQNHDRHQKGLGINFHCFPKDNEIKSKWINACKRTDSFTVHIARVCSVHFDESDYIRDLKSELLNLPKKHVLKPNAVPHLNLPLCSALVNSSSSTCVKRKIRAEKRNNHKEVQNLLQLSLIHI